MVPVVACQLVTDVAVVAVGLGVALGGVVGVYLAVAVAVAVGLIGAEGGGGPVVEGEPGGLVAHVLPAFGIFGGTGTSS